MITATLFCVFKGKIGETYNIGSGINLNNIQIAKHLIEIAKREIPIEKMSTSNILKIDLVMILDMLLIVVKLNEKLNGRLKLILRKD